MKNAKIIENNVDTRVIVRNIIGRMTIARFALLREYARRKSFTHRCNHTIDNCHCLNNQHVSLIANDCGAKIVIRQSFNY